MSASWRPLGDLDCLVGAPAGHVAERVVGPRAEDPGRSAGEAYGLRRGAEDGGGRLGPAEPGSERAARLRVADVVRRRSGHGPLHGEWQSGGCCRERDDGWGQRFRAAHCARTHGARLVDSEDTEGIGLAVGEAGGLGAGAADSDAGTRSDGGWRGTACRAAAYDDLPEV